MTNTDPQDKKTAHILIPLPDHDFDPTESATPWKVFKQRGWEVTFSTEQGAVAQADHRLLKGPILGPLGAGRKAINAYRQMTQDVAYRRPILYSSIDPAQFDALVLTGGHAPGMKQYLDSSILQKKAAEFWLQGKVIGAICHGVVVLARTIDPRTGKSILYGSKTTALTKDLERTGFLMTFWLLGRRYRTYPCYVEDEIRGCLEKPEDFIVGRSKLIPHVVRDGRLISGRWPLDAAQFSEQVARAIEENG